MNSGTFLLPNGTLLVNRIAQYIHNATQRLRPHRNRDGRASILNAQTAADAFGGAHCNRTDDAVTQLLLHFERQTFLTHRQCVIHLRHAVSGKLHVDDGTNNLYDLSATHFPVLVT